jgi:hypothetical protein
MASYAKASEEVMRENSRSRSTATCQSKTGSSSWQKSTKKDSSVRADFLQKKKKEFEPQFHRTGVFSPIGAGKQVQGAVLRAMQLWVWDEWRDYGFRMARLPDGRILYFDPKEGDWQAEEEIMSLTKMIVLVNSGYADVGPIDIDDLNEYGIRLFHYLKDNRHELSRYRKESAAVLGGYEIEEVEWDELPDDIRDFSEDALPF